MTMSADLWQLPGPAAFLDRVCRLADDGRCVLLCMPCVGRPDGLISTVGRRFQGRRTVFETRVEQLWGPGASTPLEKAASAMAQLLVLLDLRGEHGFIDPTDVVMHPDRGRDLLLVDCQGTHASEQDAVVRLLESLAAANKAAQPDQRLPVVVAADGNALTRPPQADVMIDVVWWWGICSPLDTEVVVARHGVADPVLRSMVTEIAAWDLVLVEELAAAWTSTIDDFSTIVPPWPHPPSVSTAVDGLSAKSHPPPSLIGAWSAGEVQLWRDRIRVHSSVVAPTDPGILLRRAWAGQVASIFPDIEMERSRLARLVRDEAVRRSLPTVFEVASGEPVPVDELELGPLMAYVSSNRALRIAERHRRMLRELRQVRNDLAHLRPVALERVRRLRTLIDSDQAE